MRVKFLRDMVFAGKPYTAGSVVDLADSRDLRRSIACKWVEVLPEKKPAPRQEGPAK